MTGGRVMKTSSNSSGRRLRRGALAAILAVTAVTALGVQNASADAGNPILGTIQGSIVPDPTGPGATVYVRGEWNWLSHNSDCNFDRAGTGVGIIWNDPNGPGFTVTKGSVSAGVGVQDNSRDTTNKVDQMVHPVDRGNQAEGYTASGDYPAGQTFVDPSPPDPNSYNTWKGGCGREPLTATQSKSGGTECAVGNSTCSGHPWGSWGYEVNDGHGHVGYSHHFKDRGDIKSVCANFYDVHGGGTLSSGKFQLVNGAKEITVNGNGDNSIQTNAFNTAQGANCTAPVVTGPSITTTASGPVTIGSPITDTAHISGLHTPATGSITFRAYAPNANDGSVDTTCATLVYTSPTPVSVTDNGDYTSGPFTPSGANGQIAGTYEWTATYTSGDTNNPSVATNCNDLGEQSLVRKATSTVSTAQKIVIADYARVTGSSGTPGGSVTFKLYDQAGCAGNLLHEATVNLTSTTVTGVAVANTPEYTLVTNGTYSWLLSYSGDSKYGAIPRSCTESTTIAGNSPNIIP